MLTDHLTTDTTAAVVEAATTDRETAAHATDLSSDSNNGMVPSVAL